MIDPEDPEAVVFSGYVYGVKGRPIVSAMVSLNEEISVQTDKAGYFQIAIRRPRTEKGQRVRYVLNIAKPGYSLYSKVLFGGLQDNSYTLDAATVTLVNPALSIRVTDNSNDCQPSALANPPGNPLGNVPFVHDAKGNLISFKMPDELKVAFEAVKNKKSCNTGFTVIIPANSLVRVSDGTPAKGTLSVAVNTIDIFSPDGMPGDNLASSDGLLGYMTSYGAGIVDIFDERGETYQLEKGTRANIIIPVDPLILKVNPKEIPKTIPFLIYDKAKGIWVQEGEAYLKGEAYVAETTHFSEFNMDVFKTNPSCVKFRFDASIIGYPSYPVKIIGPLGSFTSRDIVITEPTMAPDFCQDIGGKDLHSLYNLPNNMPIAMVFLDPNTNAPLITHVIYTGNAADPGDLDANNVPICPYGSCAGEIVFQDFGTPSNPILAEFAESGTDGLINLSWAYVFSTPGDPGNSYTLSERQNPGDPWTILSGTIPGDTVATYVVDKDPGQFWQFQVIAADAGSDKPSNIVDVNVPF